LFLLPVSIPVWTLAFARKQTWRGAFLQAQVLWGADRNSDRIAGAISFAATPCLVWCPDSGVRPPD